MRSNKAAIKPDGTRSNVIGFVGATVSQESQTVGTYNRQPLHEKIGAGVLLILRTCSWRNCELQCPSDFAIGDIADIERQSFVSVFFEDLPF